MKKLIRLLGILAGLGAAAWLAKDRLLPSPPAATAPVPHIRRPEAAPAVGTPDRDAAPPAEPAAEPTTAPGEAPSAPPPDGDDLTRVRGIGPVYAARLGAVGIATFADLAAADPTVIAARVDVAVTQAESWVGQAAQFTAESN